VHADERAILFSLARATARFDIGAAEVGMRPLSSLTMASEAVGNIYVVAQARENPHDAEWDSNVERQASLVPDGLRVLVWSEGGGPDAKQRARLAERLAGYQPLTAILTPSAMARAIGVAISWVNPSVRMFPPEALAMALAHLQTTPAERASLEACLARVRARTGQHAQRSRAG
jgi:hypothetical protein